MNSILKKTGIELIWLVLLFIAAYFINVTIIKNVGTDIEINFHDTYYISNIATFLFPIYAFIVLLAYLVRGTFEKYQNLVINSTLIVASVSCLFFNNPFYFLLGFDFFHKKSGGWTIDENATAINTNVMELRIQMQELMYKYYFITEIALIVLLVVICLKTGYTLSKQKNETQPH